MKYEYNPSIIQRDQSHCFNCGSAKGPFDRHEVFGGAFRQKSKRDGLWVVLCHEKCHLEGVHKYPARFEWLKTYAQRKAMEHYGWDKATFIAAYGKNYIDEIDEEGDNA